MADPRYGHSHQRLRRRLALVVAAGGATCTRCGQPIRPGQPWDLGHVEGNPYQYAGPQHAMCNRNTANERNAADPAPRPRTRW
jgi:hypothetical protein